MSSNWENQLNAQLYEEYTQRFPMYHHLGKVLVDLTEPLTSGTTVLDLACGTGIVTVQLAERLKLHGTVIGVDFSAAMLAIAQRKLPNKKFYRAKAEQIADVLPKASVDIAVCNSAFWQMHARAVLMSLKQVLKPGGRFIFNLPMSRAIDKRTLPQLTFHMQRIAREEYGYVSAQHRSQSVTIKGKRQTVPIYSTFEEVSTFLEDMSLSLHSSPVTLEIEHTSESLYAFNRIPVMTASSLTGLDYALRVEILEKAYHCLDKTFRTTALWRYFVLENKR